MPHFAVEASNDVSPIFQSRGPVEDDGNGRESVLVNSLESLGFLSVFKACHQVSSPEEFHPEALSAPYLNVSAHTAPAMEPRRTPICQCAHNFGSRLEIRATQ